VTQYRLTIFAGRGLFCLALGIGVNGGGGKHAAECHQYGSACNQGHRSPPDKFTYKLASEEKQCCGEKVPVDDRTDCIWLTALGRDT
jgi:hypothetical protein